MEDDSDRWWNEVGRQQMLEVIECLEINLTENEDDSATKAERSAEQVSRNGDKEDRPQ